MFEKPNDGRTQTVNHSIDIAEIEKVVKAQSEDIKMLKDVVSSLMTQVEVLRQRLAVNT